MVVEYLKGYSRCRCDTCGEEFWKRTAELNRNRREGLEHDFCCRGHAIQHSNSHPSEARKAACSANVKKMRESGRRRRPDDLSSFRYFLRSVRRRAQGSSRKSNGVTLQDLKEQWERQGGVCPYTGIPSPYRAPREVFPMPWSQHTGRP